MFFLGKDVFTAACLSRGIGCYRSCKKAEERDQIDGDDLIEPPVPPGLGQLTAPLRAFKEFFDVDQDLVGAAAITSPPLKATEEPIERWVPLLPEAERNAFLVRAARGEPIGAELLRRLREVGGVLRPTAATALRRPFSSIVAAAEEVRRQRVEREQANRIQVVVEGEPPTAVQRIAAGSDTWPTSLPGAQATGIVAARIGQEDLAATAAALAVAEQLAPVRRQQREIGGVGDCDEQVGILGLGFVSSQRANQRDARHTGNLAGRVREGQHAGEQVGANPREQRRDVSPEFLVQPIPR